MVNYYEYIHSAEWKRKREWALIFWGKRCATCFSRKNIEVHHRTYERLGHELITDLIVLCDNCHETFHNSIGRSNGPEPIQAVLLRVATHTLERV